MGALGNEEKVIRRLVLPAGAIAPGDYELSTELAHYVRRVLRLRPNDNMFVSDGAGVSAHAQIINAETIHISNIVKEPAPKGPRLTLIQGIAKGDKMDSVIRQATELGVSCIRPTVCERSVAHHKGRLERWKTIAEDAVRVSGRVWRPQIQPIVPLDAVFKLPRQEHSFCLSLNAGRLMPSSVQSAEILIGPEGGLTSSEIEAAKQAGFEPVQFGEHTLRTETAGPACLSVLMYGSGGFG